PICNVPFTTGKGKEPSNGLRRKMKGPSPMDSKRFGIRAGLVAGAAAALISGAAWHGLAATSAAAPAATAQATTQAPIVTGRAAAVNGSRDSYADVVKAVAPAVVTIRIDGKATASPAQFDGD